MQQIQIKLTARSPLAIGQRKPGGSVSEALDYIPGTVIRGAIAKEILKRSDSAPTEDESDDFYQLFVSEQAAVFQNGYSAIAKIPSSAHLDTYTEISAPAQVMPATALSNKTEPGFRLTGKAGVFDSLIDSYCAKSRGLSYAPTDLQGNAVDSLSGFYSSGRQGYLFHTVRKRLLTRVGINRRRATAEDEILYSVEVIDDSQGKQASGKQALGKQEPQPSVFYSSIWVNSSSNGGKELADRLEAFLRQHCATLGLGGSVSRGLGRVKLEIIKPSGQSSIANRIKAFNHTLKARWQLWNALTESENVPDKRLFIALTFQSDAILQEQWRRTTVLSAEMLLHHPLFRDLQLEDICLEDAHSSHDYRSGWNAAWGLPKDVELVTNMGSVMLFSLPKPSEEKQAAIYEALAALEKVGIGERCSEGYGQIRVCDELHNVVREEAV